MYFKIILYLLLLIIGFLLNYKGILNKKVLKKTSTIQLLLLFVLIFIMGVSIGMDNDIISSIKEIGVKAFVFSILTVIFSLLVVIFISRFIIKDKTFERKND